MPRAPPPYASDKGEGSDPAPHAPGQAFRRAVAPSAPRLPPSASIRVERADRQTRIAAGQTPWRHALRQSPAGSQPPLEILHGPSEPFILLLALGSHSLEVQVVGLWIDRLRCGNSPGKWWRLPPGGDRNVRGDPLLKPNHMTQIVVVGLGPDVPLCCRANQMHGDAHTHGRPDHRPLRRRRRRSTPPQSPGARLAVFLYCRAEVREMTSRPATCVRCTVMASVTVSAK